MVSPLLMDGYAAAEVAKEILEDINGHEIDASLEELMNEYDSGFLDIAWQVEAVHRNAVIETLRWCASSTNAEIISELLKITEK